MPWKIQQKNNEYCVVKMDGSVVTCHPTKAKALAHLKALYVNVPEARK